ncbi:nitroreductase family protein [Halothermothrix orenii]|uniref:Nitroreductase n=1 Tax=Halothermothrix orenii (strain H 168 / OCM 544 / DSM 9562) TaxID=373903 RepID=B8CX52_HALOH|nr:nitroreductase family protein [Halothermothrix orenii]ACL69871.1 nitroreductase [Halothermothrix orenii H 168]
MDIYEAIKKRRSIRKYISKPVEEEKLKRVLEAGRLAPSGKNVQAWKFIITRDVGLKDKLIEACKGQKFMKEADAIITVCVNEEEVYQYHGNYMTSFAVDGAIALQQMMLAATAEGLGTCWIGAFYEKDVKKILDIPAPYRVIGLTPLGYPAERGRDRGRKPLKEIVYNEKWGNSYN